MHRIQFGGRTASAGPLNEIQSSRDPEDEMGLGGKEEREGGWTGSGMEGKRKQRLSPSMYYR